LEKSHLSTLNSETLFTLQLRLNAYKQYLAILMDEFEKSKGSFAEKTKFT